MALRARRDDDGMNEFSVSGMETLGETRGQHWKTAPTHLPPSSTLPVPSLSPTEYSKVDMESPLMSADHSQLGSGGSGGTGLGKPKSSYGLD